MSMFDEYCPIPTGGRRHANGYGGHDGICQRCVQQEGGRRSLLSRVDAVLIAPEWLLAGAVEEVKKVQSLRDLP